MTVSTPFAWVVAGCVVVIALSLVVGMVLMLRTRDVLTRAVVADLVFYGMICMYAAYATSHPTPLAADIILLASIVAGVLPTISMARIISQGRR